MIGQIFGNYRVVDKIGVGGMGAVYKAEHTMMGKPAALKVLLPQFSMRKTIVARFFNEAKAASAIRNPGIVEIYDFGYAQDGSAYILMEFLGGESLQHRLERMSLLPTDQSLHLLRQIARSLSAAHRQGIVHRDLKPDNIFIVPDEEVHGGERTKVLDFGIAKLSDEHDSSVKTNTGAVMGTPKYMAPEQCKGAGGVDHRADLYSLGCILFQMLCGRTPFVAQGNGEIMAQHIYMQPPVPSSIQPSIAPEMDAFILHLLAKEKAQRVQSADEIVGVIDRFLGAGQHGHVRVGTMGLDSIAETTRMGQVVLSPNTTLSAGAVPVSHSTMNRRSRRRLVVPVAVVGLLALGIGAAVWLGQRGDDNTSSATASASAPLENERNATTPATAGASATVDTGGDSQKSPLRSYTIASEPVGAEVWVDGKSTGEKTPYQVTLPEGESRVFTLVHEHHQSTDVAVPGDADAEGKLDVALPPTEVAEAKPEKSSQESDKTSSRTSSEKSGKKSSRTSSRKSGKKSGKKSSSKKSGKSKSLKTDIDW